MTLTAPYSDPDTSHDAAVWVQPDLKRQLAMVYAVIVTMTDRGGVTVKDLELATGLDDNSLRPRLWHLEGNRGRGKPKAPALIRKDGKRNGCAIYRAVREAA